MSHHKLLFVCLGNICRSPMAEGVFSQLAAQQGHSGRFRLDSAGTAAWHEGKPPDPRGQAAAGARGIDLSGLRARQVRDEDFDNFDLILAMDGDNLEDLKARAPSASAHKIRLFLDDAKGLEVTEVPDPYYGGDEGFEDVLDLLTDGSKALMARLIQVR